MTDWQLLRQFVESDSQQAFAEIVRRHIGWVRASALRQVRDAHLADDVAQAVFLALARQAARLHQGAQLSTWLFKVTRYASSAALRGESRRRRHERQAAMMTRHREDTALMTPQQWEMLAPELDKLVGRLRSGDQRAVLLRFYEQKSYPEMAVALGVSEEAARKRTDRAVEKLRHLVGSRQLVPSAEALSAGLAAHAVAPASEWLCASAAALGSRAGEGVSMSVASIAKGAIGMMNIAKLRLPVAALAALALVAGVGVTMLDAGPKPGAATPATPATPAATQPARPTTAAVAEDSPKAVVFAAFRAAADGDAEGLIGRFQEVTPQQAQTLRQTSQLLAAAKRLGDAVKEQFGEAAAEPFARMIGLGVAEFDITSAMEDIHGQTATVNIGAGPGEVPLVRSGETWKISPAVLATLNAGAVRQFAARLPAIDQLTKDVRAGKYKTPQELGQALAGLMRPPQRRGTTTAAAQR